MGELVRLEVADGVGTVRLDRPKMNVIDSRLVAELRAAAVEAGERDDVRALVLYGGERVFAAGADIAEMAQLSYAQVLPWVAALQDTFRLVARLPKPVVAAVTGYALGGGFELALTADFRVVGESARMGLPEITLGVIPGAGGTQRLSRLVGPARAKDLIFTGRQVEAQEALALGIADRVVADAAVLDSARELAARFASGPAVALRAAKAAVDDGLEVDLDAGLRLEQALFTGLFATDDRAAGMAAFLERRPGGARFSGR